MDIVGADGWYEQPAEGTRTARGRSTPSSSATTDFGNGGGEMGVYDVNGDGLTDVVNALQAHGWGLAWFEQKNATRTAHVTFEQHMIADDFSTKNAGDVVFSEPHAARFADMDGDGIPDFVIGKRLLVSHLESYNGADPYGAAVLYIYRRCATRRRPAARSSCPS